ncbi:hypothetical protein BD311DRAFT_765830 [Dichomitus squalens]|uniref:Uncharacterized protein n=1 Tax=Dichomitus squalens TaxID=114155 RepID=A0A4Q9MFG1_9APHY|nr:hypothetical protein BD311DRAFT_765830 [Dichomitus squalens]
MLAPRAMHAYAELRMSNAPSLTASNHACMHQWSTPHTWPSHSQSRRSFLPALPVRSMPVHHEAAYTDYRYADQSDRVEEDWTKVRRVLSTALMLSCETFSDTLTSRGRRPHQLVRGSFRLQLLQRRQRGAVHATFQVVSVPSSWKATPTSIASAIGRSVSDTLQGPQDEGRAVWSLRSGDTA